MKPIIGISVDCASDPSDHRTHGKLTLNWNYAEAVAEAGGVPILIPPTADMEVIASIIDGYLIPGGDDIDGSRFGEENHPAITLQDPARYEAEDALLQRLDAEVPVLGICYGAQFFNVARGGSIVQHLPEVVGHENDRGGTLQEYFVDSDSQLGKVVGAQKICGQSWHHQSVKVLGAHLKVVARNEDGTVEAIEATDRPWLIGVQWHPERTLNDESTRNLFRAFVEAAAQHAARRSAVPA